MIILNTSANAQTLSVIPREYLVDFVMTICDDSTNVIETYNITNAVQVGNYLTFTNIFNPILVENHFYDLTLKTVDSVIYKDKIFCTNQDIDQENNDYYKINKDQYTNYNGYDNTYLVI
jgi:hypothetical protein